MKVINIIDSTEGCHIGFLPGYIIKRARRNEMKDAFGQVILLFMDVTLEVVRRKNDHLYGVASFRLLQDIKVTE